MNHILTFDVGTTAIKTSIFRDNLELLAARIDEYDLITENGHVELDCEVYWQTLCRALADLGTRVPLSEIGAICMTTQGETLIPVDQDGQPLHRAVVWLDDRAGEEAALIASKVTVSEFHRHTGLPDLNGCLPLAKLLWFRNRLPECYQRTHKFLLLEDYLIFWLTGFFATEKSLQSSTGWLDLQQDTYWTDLLGSLDLSADKLPSLLECGTVVGSLTDSAASELGLSRHVQVITGAMDQIAAAIGGGGLQDDAVTATVGTALAITAQVPEEKAFAHEEMTVYRGYVPGQFVWLPYCPTAGVVLKWLKDTVCAQEAAAAAAQGQNAYDRLCAMAAAVPAGSDGVIMLPYLAGCLQPRVLPNARGAFFGLTLDTDTAVLVRSVLEAVGFMLRENLELLCSCNVTPRILHFFGGGAKNALWSQMIADITGMELVTFCESECGSLGAAMLASRAQGRCAAAANPVKERFLPDPENWKRYELCYNRYQKLFDALQPLLQEGEHRL